MSTKTRTAYSTRAVSVCPAAKSQQPPYGAFGRRRTELNRDTGAVMFFLLRVAFWLTIVLALLPSGGAQQSAQAKVGPTIGPTDAMVAAGAAVSDMTNFCDRQPDACVVGAQTAVAIGQRAQAGAKMVYEFFNDHAARGNETGSVTKSKPGPKSEPKSEPKSGPKLAP